MKVPLTLLTFVPVFLGCVITSAQVPASPPPPPPPLIYQAPDKSLLKAYISQDEGFEAVFPGDPSIKRIDASGFDVTLYETYKHGSHSTVEVYKYKSSMDKDKTAAYDLIRQNLLNKPKTRIESEIDVKNGVIEGREFDVLSDYTYKRLRVFPKGNTVYIVSCDVTNWHILTKHYQDKVGEYKSESERFFNSFRINK